MRFVSLLILLLPSICWANPMPSMLQMWAAASGGGSVTLLEEDFESDYSNGDEWSTQHSWIEWDATTNIFIVDSSVTQPDCTYCTTGGTYSGRMDPPGGAADRRIYKAFTAINSGYVTIEFDMRTSSAISQNIINLWADTTSILTFGISTTIFRFYGNSAWDDGATTYSVDTWYHIEIELNVDDSDGTDSIRLWVDNVEDSNSPFDVSGHNDPEGINRFGNNFYFAASLNYYVDNFVMYTGQRQ